MSNSSGRFDAIKDLSEESVEAFTEASNNSRKRKHPSNQEPSNPPKHSNTSNSSSDEPSSQSLRRENVSFMEKNFRFESKDKGPFQILLSIRKNHDESENKSILDITVARNLAKKYNIRFDNMEKRGKNKWMLFFRSRDQANNTLSNPLLDDSPYQVEVPWYIVFRRFVISGIPTDISDEELLLELKEQNPDTQFTEIMRFRKSTFSEGKSNYVPLTTIKITIRSTTIPSTVYLWNTIKKTRVFIPNTRQCLKCGQLTHSAKFCKNKDKCLTCGQEYDEHHEICSLPAKCINCNGNHPSLDKSCPELINKQKITKLMAINNINFNEAKNILFPKFDGRSRSEEFPEIPHRNSQIPGFRLRENNSSSSSGSQPNSSSSSSSMSIPDMTSSSSSSSSSSPIDPEVTTKSIFLGCEGKSETPINLLADNRLRAHSEICVLTSQQ